MVYLQRGLVITGANALSVTDNFIAECGNCVELVASGHVNDNLLGAGPVGFTVFAEGHFGLIISGRTSSRAAGAPYSSGGLPDRSVEQWFR